MYYRNKRRLREQAGEDNSQKRDRRGSLTTLNNGASAALAQSTLPSTNSFPSASGPLTCHHYHHHYRHHRHHFAQQSTATSAACTTVTGTTAAVATTGTTTNNNAIGTGFQSTVTTAVPLSSTVMHRCNLLPTTCCCSLTTGLVANSRILCQNQTRHVTAAPQPSTQQPCYLGLHGTSHSSGLSCKDTTLPHHVYDTGTLFT